MGDIFEGKSKEIKPVEIEQTEIGLKQRPQSDIERSISEQLYGMFNQGINLPGLGQNEILAQNMLSQYGGSGMSDIYNLGKSQLEETLGGGYDPSTSPYYASIKDEAANLKKEGAADIRHAAAIGGNLAGGRRISAEGDLYGDIDRQTLSILGDLFEGERNRMTNAIPQALQYGQFADNSMANKIQALSQYGAIPREVDASNMLTQINTKQGLAGTLQSYLPQYYTPQYQSKQYYTPQYQYEPSLFSQVAGPAAGLISAFSGGGQ